MFCERSTNKYDIIDYGVITDLQKKILYRICWKLSSLTENYIIEGDRLTISKIQGCYFLKKIPNILSNTFSDFISDMGVNDHRHWLII